MNTDTVRQALDALEAAAPRAVVATRAREGLSKALDAARNQAAAAADAAETALAAAERGSVSAVRDAASLARVAQKAALSDVHAALACCGRIVEARTPADVLRAQADYLKSQTRTNLGRWRAAGGLVTQTMRGAVSALQEGVASRTRTP